MESIDEHQQNDEQNSVPLCKVTTLVSKMKAFKADVKLAKTQLHHVTKKKQELSRFPHLDWG